MIRPGLLTASTNKADHLGTSGAGLVAYRCIVRCSFRCAWFWSLVLKTGVFPLRSDVGTRVGARPTQGLPERSGGLGGFAESCRAGSRGTMRAKKGETKSKRLACNGTEWNGGESEWIY